MSVIGRVIGAAAFVAALAGTGFAEQNWNGAYAGLDLGYGWGSNSASFPRGAGGNGGGLFGPPAVGGNNGSAGALSQALHGGTFGLHAGHLVPVWRELSAGLEVSYLASDIKANSENNFLSTGNTDKVGYTSRVKRIVTVTPQFAWSWDRWLAKFKGGLAVAQVDMSAVDVTQKTTFQQQGLDNGWVIGLGADYAVSEHWLAGLSWDYYSFASKQYGGRVDPDTTWPLEYRIRPIIRTLTAHVSYKF